MTYPILANRLCVGVFSVLTFVLPLNKASAMTVIASEDNLYDLIRTLADSRMPNPAVVEEIVGTKLLLVRNSVPDHYEAYDIKIKDVTVDLVQYWQPITNEDRNIGPWLELQLSGICIRKGDIFRRYDPSDSIVQATPSDWGQMTGKTEPWGDLFFGFSDQTPDCLKTVIIDMRHSHKK